MPQRSKWSLIGIPDHQGVIEVGGRIGASRGPRAFRSVFGRMRGRGVLKPAMLDCGDLTRLSGDLVRDHRAAADLIRDSHARSGLSVIVGGGHDHGHSHLLGISEAAHARPATPLQPGQLRPRLGCINIDAHLDVRKPAPVITSGSPFYLALEAGLLQPENFVEFGIQSHCNGPELWEYIDANKIRVVPFKDLRHGLAPGAFRKELERLADTCDEIVISLDLDAAAAAFAPGVSAPQAEGFTASDVIEMMEIAGNETKVHSLGIFELNPEHDVDDRTARLAATSAWHFIESALARS